jgi:hypothetical protein
MTPKKYIGIVDAHGLQSIKDASKANRFSFEIRARSNRHRNAMVYQVELTKKQFANVKHFCHNYEPRGH